MGEMAVMGREGDVKTIWDQDNPDEVEAARKQFDDLKKKGFTAFHVSDRKGETGERMDVFDPTAGKVIFVPRMAGG